MKLKINRDHFTEGLQKVQNIVAIRTSMPILSNVLLEAKDDYISLATTNLDLGIRCKIKAEVEKEGMITLPVKKLSTIVKSLPSLEVEMNMGVSNQVKITSRGVLFRIMGIGKEEFPALPTVFNANQVTLEQAHLAQMLKRVAYAQSNDGNRYILNGVYLNFIEGKLTMVATDGRRLSLMTQAVEIDKSFEGAIILPAKTATEIERLMGTEGSVKITFSDRQAAFDISESKDSEGGLMGNVYLVSKVIEGTYPNYKQVIPKETSYRVKIDREMLLESLSRASLITNDKNNSVRLKINKNNLEISSSSPELGECRESVAIAHEGPEVKLAFNPQFLIDPLRALDQDEVFFEFKDELSPGLFKTLDSFLCVIMPLRLN